MSPLPDTFQGFIDKITLIVSDSQKPPIDKIKALTLMLTKFIEDLRPPTDFDAAPAIEHKLDCYLYVVDLFEASASQYLIAMQLANQFAPFLELARFINEHGNKKLPEGTIQIAAERTMNMRTNLQTQMRSLPYSDDAKLVAVLNSINDIPLIEQIVEKLKCGHYALSNKNVQAALNYCNLVSLLYDLEQGELNSETSVKIICLIEVTELYTKLLDGTKGNQAIREFIKLNELWHACIYSASSVYSNPNGPTIKSSKLVYCRNSPNSPSILRELLLKFTMEYISTNFLEKPPINCSTKPFTTTLIALQQQIDKIRAARTNTHTQNITTQPAKPKKVLISCDMELIRECLDLIHELHDLYNSQDQAEIVQMARAMQSVYISSLNRTELFEYYAEIYQYLTADDAGNSRLMQQYFLETKAHLEDQFAQRYTGSTIPQPIRSEKASDAAPRPWS